MGRLKDETLTSTEDLMNPDNWEFDDSELFTPEELEIELFGGPDNEKFGDVLFIIEED